jgi:hypothetical protein
MGLFAEELDAASAVELRLCHTFVRSLETLLKVKLMQKMAGRGHSNLLLEKSEEWLSALLKARRSDSARSAELRTQLIALVGTSGEPSETFEFGHALDRAVMAARYVSPEVAQFYFARARECEIAGILRHTPPPDWQAFRSLVFDLPSLPNAELRLLVVHQVLSRLWTFQRQAWQKAMENPAVDDQRVPQFIVVDEAHNLIPATPQSRAAEVVRDVFRTVAAEGRKFGLFLIVVSQRPDKLDTMILSECQNKIVMRLDSPEVLEKVQNSLGVSGDVAEHLAGCLKYRTGRALLLGGWSPGEPTKFMSAARRTVEGGRSLNPRYWTQPA